MLTAVHCTDSIADIRLTRVQFSLTSVGLASLSSLSLLLSFALGEVMPGLPAPAVKFCRCSSSHCCFLSNNDSTVVADKRFRLADKIAPVIENSLSTLPEEAGMLSSRRARCRSLG